jgi:hypothetical protein
MSVLVPRKPALALGAYVLALLPLPTAGCNGGHVTTSGSQATEGTDGSLGPTNTSIASASGGRTGTDHQTDGQDTTVDAASATTDDTGPEPFPEECYEPEALIEVMTAMSPDGPMTIDEAWLGVDLCTKLPYIVLARYPSPETGASRTKETLIMPYGSPANETFFGVYPLVMIGESETSGTIDVLEPLEGLELGKASGDRHLHALIELHGGGWDLSLEVDLLDCGVWDCHWCACE